MHVIHWPTPSKITSVTRGESYDCHIVSETSLSESDRITKLYKKAHQCKHFLFQISWSVRVAPALIAAPAMRWRMATCVPAHLDGRGHIVRLVKWSIFSKIIIAVTP